MRALAVLSVARAAERARAGTAAGPVLSAAAEAVEEVVERGVGSHREAAALASRVLRLLHRQLRLAEGWEGEQRLVAVGEEAAAWVFQAAGLEPFGVREPLPEGAARPRAALARASEKALLYSQSVPALGPGAEPLAGAFRAIHETAELLLLFFELGEEEAIERATERFRDAYELFASFAIANGHRPAVLALGAEWILSAVEPLAEPIGALGERRPPTL